MIVLSIPSALTRLASRIFSVGCEPREEIPTTSRGRPSPATSRSSREVRGKALSARDQPESLASPARSTTGSACSRPILSTCIRRDTEDGLGPWKGRINPTSGNPLSEELSHRMIGRDLSARQRQRDGFRRRIPRTLPKVLEPTAIQKLIDNAGSYRDKAILMLLSRAGQRIGDWSPDAGRHGIPGMALKDVDRKRHFITVRLKGARDQHRVPVTDDFWPLYEEYLRTERRAALDVHAVWIASRKGQGQPLRYASFESALRYIGRKAGISVHPHLFRHTLAQGVLETTGNIKVAQEILGHSNLSTAADLYLRVDQHAMVTALVAAKSSTERATNQRSWPSTKAAQPTRPGRSLASCQLIPTAITAGASRVASGLLCVHAIAITPAGWMELVRSSLSTDCGLPCVTLRSAPAIVFSRPAQRSLTLQPARSPSRQATLYTESSDSFVASAAASIDTGWSEPVPGREFHPLKSSAFHGALLRQP
jgi:integrase